MRTIFCIIIIVSNFSVAQDLDLYGEKINENVFLIWDANNWKDDYQKFRLKVKYADNIEVLSKEITPEISSKKNLKSVIATENSEFDTLYSRQLSTIEKEKLYEIDETKFRSFLIQGHYKTLGMLFRKNYNYALFAGFGFIDNSHEQKSVLPTYYLYTVNDKGEEAFQDSIKIQNEFQILDWEYEFDFNEFQEVRITVSSDTIGYNKSNPDFITIELFKRIGSESKKLIRAFNTISKTNDIVSLHFLDPHFLKNEINKYYIQSKSYFGSINKPFYFEYDPANLFTDLEIPEPTVYWTDPEAKLEKGLKVAWEIDPSYNEIIDHFEVYYTYGEFGNWDTTHLGNYTPETRFMIDTLEKEDNETYRYHLMADFKKQIESQTSSYNFRYEKPYIPDLSYTASNLQGVVINEDGTYKVKFTWDAPEKTDIKGYRLAVAYYRGDGLAVANDLPLITGTEYILTPWNNLGDHMGFAIVTIKNDGSQARPWSQPLSLTTPSNKIYDIYDVETSLTGNTATLNWEYSDLVKDLEKFEIYQNKELVDTLVAKEGQTAFSWTSGELPSGKSTFQVKAITMYGLETPLSFPKSVMVK